ncbi:hypothetical protein P7C73_g5407, partial [Tremellales sp. Uapishka_1]
MSSRVLISPPNEIPPSLLPLVTILSTALRTLTDLFHRLPGSPIIVRYIKSSYQDDPYRSLLEVLLVAFALRTLLKGRTRGEGEGNNWVKLSEKEIDELVDDWTPQPLVDNPTELDESLLVSLPVIHGPNGVKVKLSPGGKPVINLATPNWVGLIENEKQKTVALDALRVYGVGSCGPSGFYGHFDTHFQIEKDLTAFMGTEAAIVYGQSFAAVSSVIPAFAKRGDTIVADRGINFGIHKGMQISRSQIKWFAHGDMKDLERVLAQVDRDLRRKGGKLGRRFIVAEGIFENDGMMLDLPRVIELKKKYKYRLMLDESISFGMVGKYGRGLTEYYNIPATEVDILMGSMANGLGAGGGFCAGAAVVVSHQRINSSAAVFTASLPPMLCSASSSAISFLLESPQLLGNLQTNILAFRQILSKLEPLPLQKTSSSDSLPLPSSSAMSFSPSATNKDAIISIPSHSASGLIHIFLLHPPPTLDQEEKLLQDVVDEVLNTSGVLITRARRLRGQEVLEPEPSLKICLSGALTKKEVESAAKGLKAALIKVVGKKR